MSRCRSAPEQNDGHEPCVVHTRKDRKHIICDEAVSFLISETHANYDVNQRDGKVDGFPRLWIFVGRNKCSDPEEYGHRTLEDAPTIWASRGFNSSILPFLA